MPLPPSWTPAEAKAEGLSRGHLRSTSFVRIAHGLTARLDDAIDEAERLRLLTRVLPSDAAYSHATAGALLGAPVDAPRPAHIVLTPRRVLPQRAEFVTHSRRLLPEDVVQHHGLRLTSGPQTYLDLAGTLPPWELVAVGDALMRAGHLDQQALARRLARAARVRGVVRARDCAPLLSPLAMSRPESMIRYWLTVSHLPTPVLQLPVNDRWGQPVTHVDLGYDGWRIALEYEGRQHADADQFDRDVDRYSLMAADGWLVLRFARRHLHAPGVVVDRTRRALLSRGWRDPRG